MFAYSLLQQVEAGKAVPSRELSRAFAEIQPLVHNGDEQLASYMLSRYRLDLE